MQATVIFAPGAFIRDSIWWWHRMAPLLEEHGIASDAVEYPSCGPAGPLGDLYADADALMERVEAAAPGPVILVGHSYGGMVITDAGAHPRVEHLVYMSAFVPDGLCAAEAGFMKDEDLVAITGDISEDGTAGEAGTKVPILSLLPSPELVSGALERLTRQSVDAGFQVARAEAWRDKPTTYLVLTGDADIAVARQRTAAELADRVVELPTNHYAHLERPDLVTAALVEITEGLLQGAGDAAR